MTAVQRNQIKTDNKWSAEEACGHRAEVRELLTTTITHSASVVFICSILPLSFSCLHHYLTFFLYSLPSSQTLLWLPFTLSEFSLFFHLFQPLFSLFLSFVWHFPTSFCVYWTVSLCLLVTIICSLFSYLMLYLCLESLFFEAMVKHFWKYTFCLRFIWKDWFHSCLCTLNIELKHIIYVI